MRILVCGGRDFTDWVLLEQTLHEMLYNLHKAFVTEIVFISGGARGADALAKDFALSLKHLNIGYEEYPADWDKHGKAAGSIRNQQMLDEGKPDLVVAFPTKNSRGTYDMIRRAKLAGVEVVQVTHA